MTERAKLRVLAMRLAGACHSRRLYAADSPSWKQTLEFLNREIHTFFDTSDANELTFALFEDGLAVAGLPIADPPNRVQRMTHNLQERDIEIISIKCEYENSELETLLMFLTADAADVAGVRGNTWLRERGAERIEIKHLRVAGGGMQSFRDVYRLGHDVMEREFGRARAKGHVDMRPIRELSSALLDLIFNADTPIATLVALSERDDYTYVHSVNVGMLAGCQASTLGLSEEQVREIATAGLLHDIGKTRMPEDILRASRGDLTHRDEQILATHTLEGARILYATQGAQRVAPLVAYEHHARWDEVDHVNEPILASQLVSLADTFDSIRTLRPFDDRESMRSALGFIFARMRKRFNPYFLLRFATMCGLFLPGDHVRLSTGEVAEVLEIDDEDPLHPRVEVVDPGKGAAREGTFLDLARHARGASPIRVVIPITSHFKDLQVIELDRLG